MEKEEKATCQICAREIKAKFGVIAHHGYQRPYEYTQTASCMGARHLPYEKSRDVILVAIEQIKSFIENHKALIEKVKVGNISVPYGYRKFVMIEPTDKFYSIRQGEYLDKLKWEIELAERDVVRLQKRYDDWKISSVLQEAEKGGKKMEAKKCIECGKDFSQVEEDYNCESVCVGCKIQHGGDF